MIKLGYLKGYNSFNVPSFPTKQARDTFFDNITGLVEIDAYYPPFYTNVIKLDITQVSQSVPYNFVILVHNDEYYYYFIDKINYINEDVFEIVINMDSILTDMFDVKIKDCVVTRNSMKRWTTGIVDYKINREYIRENISEGFFEVNTYEYVDDTKWVVILKSGSNHCHIDGYDIGYDVVLAPVISSSSSGSNIKVIDALHNEYTRGDYFDYSEYIDDPDTINIFITYGTSIEKWLGYRFVYGSPNTIYLDNVSIGSNFDLSFVSSNGLGFIVHRYIRRLSTYSLKRIDINNLEFTKNTHIGQLFNLRYIPQLIDENYYQIQFGEYKGFTSYPLHLLKEQYYYFKSYTNFTNGDNIYMINSMEDTTLLDDINRNNTAMVSIGTSLELINDAWKSYLSQNKASLTTGIKLKYTNTLYDTITGTMKNLLGVSQAQEMSDMWGNVRKKPYKIAKLGVEQQIVSGAMNTAIGIGDGLMQAYNIKKNYDITKENLEYTPDTSKGSTSYYSELLCSSNKPFIKVLLVSDIETVARKLELYGYKQNKSQIYTTSKLINEIENIRYYYNCLELQINDYELLRMIPNDIINDFTDRLSRGIRLFDMTHNTNLSDNLIYDNVETEEIIGE